jgi:hypothetical protein
VGIEMENEEKNPFQQIDQIEVGGLDYRKTIEQVLVTDDRPDRKGRNLYKLGYLAAKSGDISGAKIAFEFLILTPSSAMRIRKYKTYSGGIVFCRENHVEWTQAHGETQTVRIIDISAEHCEDFDGDIEFEVDNNGNLTKFVAYDEEDYSIFFNSFREDCDAVRFPYLDEFSCKFHYDDIITSLPVTAPRLRQLEFAHHSTFVVRDFPRHFFTPLVSSLEIGRDGSLHHEIRYDILENFPALKELYFSIWEFKYNDSDFSILPILTNLEKFHLSHNVELDIPHFSADSLLRYVDWLDDIEPFRELVSWIGDFTENKKYVYNWRDYFGMYQTYSLLIPKQTWMLNKAVLYNLKLPQYLGYTGNLNEILLSLPEKYKPKEISLLPSTHNCWDYSEKVDPEKRSSEFKSIQDLFRNRLEELSLEQVRKGSSTILFDVNSLSKKGKEALLVKSIVDRRREEIENTVLYQSHKGVDLSPLWITHYGFELLRNLGLGLTCSQSEFSRIAEHLNELDLNVKVTSDVSKVKAGCVMPETHRQLILSRLTPTMYESIEQRLARFADFPEFPMNPWVALYSDYLIDGFSEEHPKSDTWLQRRDRAAERLQISYRKGQDYSRINITRNY